MQKRDQAMSDLAPTDPDQNRESSTPTPEAPPEAVSPVEVARLEILIQLNPLLQRVRAGANWFLWIAGLSLVNSIVMHADGKLFFVMGLGVTVVADSIAEAINQMHPDVGPIAKAIALGFDVVVAAVVAGFGLLARRR